MGLDSWAYSAIRKGKGEKDRPLLTLSVGHVDLPYMDLIDDRDMDTKRAFRSIMCHADHVVLKPDAYGGLEAIAAKDLKAGHALPFWGSAFLRPEPVDYDSMDDRVIEVVRFNLGKGHLGQERGSKTLFIQGSFLCPATYANSSTTPNAELRIGTHRQWEMAMSAVKYDTKNHSLMPLWDRLGMVKVSLTKSVSAGDKILLNYNHEDLPQGRHAKVSWDFIHPSDRLQLRKQ